MNADTAGAIPQAVIAWRDAYQTYVDAVAFYNERLKLARSFPLGHMSVDPEYRTMNEAQRKAMSLIAPMHAAISNDAAGASELADAEKDGFLMKLKSLLTEYNADIAWSCGPFSDMHGVYDEKMIISINDKEVFVVDNNYITGKDIDV